jgi:hypothetical protein
MIRAVSLPVARVTVSEDRAVVVRRGTVAFTAGLTRVRIDGVAPVLVDKSLRVSVEQGDAKVGAVIVVREKRSTVPDDPAARSDMQALDAALDAAADRMTQLAAAVTRVGSELALLDAGARATLAEIAEDAAHGKTTPASLARTFEAREKELHADRVRLARESRDEAEHRDRIKARRAAAEHPSARAHAAIELVLSAPAAGEARLAIEYVVPGACWRPQHTATLAGSTVTLATDACVWQRTGEDWDDVELRLSTERLSLGKEPPKLTDDVLTAQRRQEVVHVEAREEAVETAGLGVGVLARVPGIDDGGEVRVLTSPGRARVPTDGRPHRFPLGSFDSAAEVESICLPQLAPAVILRSRQPNTAALPVLAGPVDLVRGGGFVGRTKVPFVAAGERFELGWGPDPGVRVRRDVEEVEEEPGILSGWIVRAVRERVYLSVLDDVRRRFSVKMRIPVSEIEKVEIAQDLRETTGAKSADSDGFVVWEVDLGGASSPDDAPASLSPRARARARERIHLVHRVKRRRDTTGI